jgi:hypothetical protein
MAGIVLSALDADKLSSEHSAQITKDQLCGLSI